MNLDYIAGIIDGEGTIGLLKSGDRYCPYVSISNNHKHMLCNIREYLGMYGLNGYMQTKQPYNKTHNINYDLRYRNRDAMYLLEIMQGRLIIKKNRMELLLKIYNLCTPRNGKYTNEKKEMKEKLYNDLKQMNKRGVA